MGDYRLFQGLNYLYLQWFIILEGLEKVLLVKLSIGIKFEVRKQGNIIYLQWIKKL